MGIGELTQDFIPASYRETVLAKMESSAEEPDTPRLAVTHSRETALAQVQLVFGKLPGATEVLRGIPVDDPENTDTAAVVHEVVNRLMTLPVIERIIGDRRGHLADIVQGAIAHGIQSVHGTALNTTVLADPQQKRYALLQHYGSGAFGYVAGAEFDSDIVAQNGNGKPPLVEDRAEEAEERGASEEGARESPDEKDPYGPPEFVAKILLDTGVDSKHVFQRFQSEQRTLSVIQSGAPPVYADGIAGGRPYFVMRKIEGHDFHDVIRSINHAMQHDEQNEIKWPSQWMYLAMASASQTMHDIHCPEGATEVVTDDARLSRLGDTVDLKENPVGLVHRDLKPSNMRIDSEGRVWILDFGLVREMDDEAARTRLTMTGETMGTPQYMSPEQVDDSKHITPAADVYAMGCVAFEMLAGIPPFAYKDKVMQVLAAHKNESPNFDLIPNEKAREIVMRMMHKDYNERPDLDQVAREFHALFLEGASDDDEREQYADFLSLPHVDRKLPMPESLDFTAPAARKSGEDNGRSLSLTRSLLTYGGDELPDIGPDLPEVYVVVNGKNMKLTNPLRIRLWLEKHAVVLASIGLVVIAGVIYIASNLPGKKPKGKGATELVQRLPTSSVSLDVDEEGRVVGISIFDESPVQIAEEDIETVKAGEATSGAFFHFGSEQMLAAMGSQDASVLPESIRERGWTTGIALNGEPESGDGTGQKKVVYIGGKDKMFFVDDGSGRICMYADNTTLLNRRSGECESWEGLDKVYDDPTFRSVVGDFTEVDEEQGELVNSKDEPNNSVSTVNSQVNAWRAQLEKRDAQATLPTEQSAP